MRPSSCGWRLLPPAPARLPGVKSTPSNLGTHLHARSKRPQFRCCHPCCAVFPLSVVALPSADVPLQIFEAR